MHHYAGYRIQLILFTMSITILVRIMTNITDEAVQKYIKEQAEESRREDSRSTAL